MYIICSGDDLWLKLENIQLYLNLHITSVSWLWMITTVFYQQIWLKVYLYLSRVMHLNYYTPHSKVVGGYTGFTMSIRLDKSYVVR
jgi:hypothetical protein